MVVIEREGMVPGIVNNCVMIVNDGGIISLALLVVVCGRFGTEIRVWTELKLSHST